MEPYTSMVTALALFAIAALGGLTMAGIRLAGKPQPPTALAMLHGLLAAAGLTLLIYAAVTMGIPAMAEWATGILVVAALGGIVINLRYHWERLTLPIPLMLLHALLAIVGFILLAICVFQQQSQ